MSLHLNITFIVMVHQPTIINIKTVIDIGVILNKDNVHKNNILKIQNRQN